MFALFIFFFSSHKSILFSLKKKANINSLLVETEFSMLFFYLDTGISPLWLNLFQSSLVFFDEIVNGIIFLISFSDSSLLVCRIFVC